LEEALKGQIISLMAAAAVGEGEIAAADLCGAGGQFWVIAHECYMVTSVMSPLLAVSKTSPQEVWVSTCDICWVVCSRCVAS
jgi:hypothetical protein